MAGQCDLEIKITKLKNMDYSKINKIHMIGIKGVGMTMLAQYLHAQGKIISGSDIPDVFMTDKILKKIDINVNINFKKDNIPDDTDLIIYSTAYSAKTNKELACAIESKVKTLSYPEALSAVFNSTYGIAVVGSHGKTTTTAWLAYVMEQSGKSPSAMIGANVPQLKGCSLNGKSGQLIIEADEYQNKLQYFSPQAVLINNIDYDHPDFFKTEDEYLKVFSDFLKKIPQDGFLVANFDDDKVRNISSKLKTKIISYGINNEADIQAYDIINKNGKQYFKIKIQKYKKFDKLDNFSISLSGEHNILNALAVIAASSELGVSPDNIKSYLDSFSGTSRRMEKMGIFQGAIILDDYAHHPTEIKTTINGAKNLYPNKKLLVVFHPHTFTRTKTLLNDFAESFSEVDELILLDIYCSAREEQGGIHSLDLKNKILENDPNLKIEYIPTLNKVEKYLRKNINSNYLVILMGAGDVFRIGESLLTNKFS